MNYEDIASKRNQKIKLKNDIVYNEGYNHKDKIIFTQAEGSYLFDSIGNKYIDTTLGSGTHLLGHKHKAIVNEISNQLDRVMLTTTINDLTFEVAHLICTCVKYIEKIVFCNSGSEATMRAARIARAYTKRNKIAIFEGGWHGGNELYLFEYDHELNQSVHKSSGIPNSLKNEVIILPYNDAKAFEIIEKNKDELAMIIIEPAQGSNPRDDMKSFLEQLRMITYQNSIVLCFDEMITGFRIGLEGTSGFYNIQPDIVTYGKTIGGGLPIGVVAGKKEIMDTIRGINENLPTFMGGTFSANPMSMAAAKGFLTYVLSHPEIYHKLNAQGDYLKQQINTYCKNNNIPIQMIGIGSMLRLVFTNYPIQSRFDRDKYELSYEKQKSFYDYLLYEKNIFINGNRIIFLSTKHSDSDIEYIIHSIIESIKNTIIGLS